MTHPTASLTPSLLHRFFTPPLLPPLQRLRNPLAVAVYEAHGRAALEYGDLAEFNQCQTQLHAMYPLIPEGGGCVAEFTAYKVGRERGVGRGRAGSKAKGASWGGEAGSVK